MSFRHVLLPRNELQAVTHENGNRYYSTPIGNLDSVTTVLARALSNSKIDDWRERVGDNEADQILTKARNRGNAVHSLCEAYLLRETISNVMPGNKQMFLDVKPFLDEYISDVYGIEFPLWSKELKAAGRSDILAKWYSINSIIDFKTARWPIKNKKDDRILKYNLQATAYAIMAEEQFEIEFPQNVIISLPDGHPPHIIVKNNHKYRDLVRYIFSEYAVDKSIKV